jgi:hypothetical protein
MQYVSWFVHLQITSLKHYGSQNSLMAIHLTENPHHIEVYETCESYVVAR